MGWTVYVEVAPKSGKRWAREYSAGAELDEESVKGVIADEFQRYHSTAESITFIITRT